MQTRSRFRLTIALALMAVIFALNGAAKTLTLQWSTWGPEAIDRKLIAAFEELHPEMKIDYIQTPHSQYHERIKVLTAGGVAPDVYLVDGYYSAEFITANMIRPIDDLIARTPGIAMHAYFPAGLLDVQYRGKTYGLPWCSAPQYYMYNADHLAEVGLPRPDPDWDRDTFLTYARKLTKTDGQRTIRWGASDQILTRTSVWPWLWGAGAQLVDETNKQFRLAEPEAVDALQWVADLHHVHGVVGGNFGQQTRSISMDYPGSLPFITGVEWPFEWDVILPPSGSTDWVLLEQELRVPSEAVYVWINAKIQNAQGISWWDDVELREGKLPESAHRLGVPPLSFDLTKATFDVPPLSELRARIPSAHPRLFVRPEGLADLREKHRRSLFTQMIWRNITTEALKARVAAMPPEPPDAKPGGVLEITAWREGVAIANDVLQRLHALGFAFLITGDESYGQAGKDLLLHVAAWDPYGTSSRARNDEISMRLLYGMSRAYDWLYPLLTEKEREIVRETMRERGNDVYLAMRRSNFEDHLLDNHLVRSMGFLGEAAIAFMGELPEAQIWFDYIVSLFVLKYPAFGGDEGGWSQGVSYWQSYISWVLEFLDAFKIATGVDLYQKPFFRNTGYFKLYAHPPKSKFGAFGDHSDSPPGQGAAQVVGWLATAFGDPAYQWYASEISGMGRVPVLPTNNFLGYIKAPETNEGLIDPVLPDDFPQSRLFSDVGWALMNVDMRDWDNNVHVKFKSSPYGSHNHSHAEQNSFMIEAYGSPLAIPSGYYPWYGSPHHKTWTWESKSKNTILVDGQGQGVQSIHAKGDIVAASFGSQFDYVLGDATPSYQGRLECFLRHLWFVKPNLIVIYDQLESGRAGTTYDWLLHSLDEMIVEAEHNRVRVPAKTAEMWVSFVTPKQLAFSLTDQFIVPPEDRDAHKSNQWHLTARANSDTGEGRFLTVLVPRPIAEAEEAPPVVRAVPATNGHGVVVDLKERSFTIAFRNDVALPLAVQGFVAEATALTVWQEGARESLMVIGGQRVEKDGKLRMSADHPVDCGAAWQCAGGTVSLELQIAEDTRATVVELGVPCRPHTVTVNAQSTDTWTYEDGFVRIELPLKGCSDGRKN